MRTRPRSARLLRSLCVLAIGAGVLTAGPPADAAVTAVPVLPPGFVDERYTKGPELPIALRFTPDGRLLVTELLGRIRVISNDVLLPTPALDLSAQICTNGERGLLGLALDPAFATNGYLYVYYTKKLADPCELFSLAANRVSRFTMVGDTIDPASERVLIDGIPSPRGNHNGGDIEVASDGLLYVSVGDGGCVVEAGACLPTDNPRGQELNTLSGKILRVNLKGKAPKSNPFAGAGSAKCSGPGSIDPSLTCREIYAYGLRNPFRMAFDPDATGGVQFLINDVGETDWEEIDQGQAGANYGWPVREGPCAKGSTTDCGPPPVGMTDPIASYHHDTGCFAIVGGIFIPAGAWPAEWDGTYLFGDRCQQLFTLQPDGSGGNDLVPFGTKVNMIDMAMGPDGSVYYTSFTQGGQIRRIVPPAA